MNGEKPMFDNLRALLEALAAPAILASIGGIARAMRFGVSSWRQFVGSVCISAFAGILVNLFITDLNLSPSFQAALVAASGYSGGCILDALQNRIVFAIQHYGVKENPVNPVNPEHESD